MYRWARITVSRYYGDISAYGVRPAFYIDPSAALEGSGTLENPYTIAEMYPYTITDLKITDVSGEGIARPDKDKSFVVEVNIVKTEERNEKDCLFAAVYDTDGVLMSLDYVRANFSFDGTCSFGFNIPAQKEQTGS